MMPFRLGTRASALAQWQAQWVATRLRELGHTVDLVLITTRGDTTQDQTTELGEGAPISGLGTVGVFTKELQRALLENRIDLAVHSLKDLPTDPVEGLTLAAVPERESPFDVLVSRQGLKLHELPRQAVIGTGSLRRRAQLLHHRPDLRMADIRGNVDSRLRKLHEGQFDAIILAEAGLNRLGFSDQITQVLPADVLLPAVGQGALGVETRAEDASLIAILQELNSSATRAAVLAERSLLFHLAGGCLAPIGAWAVVENKTTLSLRVSVLSPDGTSRLDAEAHETPARHDELGQIVARELIEKGADRLLASCRES